MKLHDRTILVQRLAAQFEKRIWESPELGELTAIEAAKVFATMAQRMLTIALREERHPDAPDKKADEA